MFGGKSSRLVATIDRFSYQKKNISIFKPKIDDRYSSSHVVTHSGLKVPAWSVETGAEMLNVLMSMESTPNVVAVDELFMIEGASDTLIWLYRNLGMTIVVSSLDLMANGKPVTELEKLMPWATRVEKCPAVCVVCGADAFYTYKKSNIDEEIQVGGADIYESRCFEHHIVINRTPKR